ncbi:cell division protein FtsQ/DivIB [Winogradskyella immobilis]|uniref:Cell division protein FtsQ/DivIB n=1 Tax=Winogradskyella immobilis TaxID=2816852 RepID=A0ABS8EJS0_9FLAO|nr:cell division protein FtsQ/DivIB [Winogradskyella immobilis]MCC1483206.1 cell division protein FtsQ/DivIB [Winogradskyella immobilis]MCG0015301.1 cell division protein FtsQ/DivIB [Winogradskyella immobilis]
MQVNYGYIKVVVLLMLVVFLYAFTNTKNKRRLIGDPNVKFMGTDNLFITHENVSKLLIQNQEGLKNKNKDIIDLSLLESALNSNAMVKKAEVYMSIDGTLSAEIEQKKPIARVHTNASYYIDDEGSFMPLSTNYSARVPLVTGTVYKNKLETVFKMAKTINEDDFLKKHVIEIHQNDDRSIELKLRKYDFNVQLGHLNQLKKKINNFKAFYQKAIKDKTINTYSSVNLRFDNQVICTKK